MAPVFKYGYYILLIKVIVYLYKDHVFCMNCPFYNFFILLNLSLNILKVYKKVYNNKEDIDSLHEFEYSIDLFIGR